MTVTAIRAVWFSATGTTEKCVRRLASALSDALGVPCTTYDYTPPHRRAEQLRFAAGDLVIWGCPVYAGRLPNLLLPYLTQKVEGNGALAVPVVLFGNRAYDDGLMELHHILRDNGFRCVAGGAFVGEHAFSTTLGAGRPDGDDLAQIDDFAAAVAEKLRRGDTAEVTVGGCDPIRPYYTPRDRHGNPINILKVKPKTDGTKCVRCGLCATRCPMGSIDPASPDEVRGVCIKCCACVKCCPTGAKYYDDPGYLYHKEELEAVYARRAENEYFL